jgi:hypothetical protein
MASIFMARVSTSTALQAFSKVVAAGMRLQSWRACAFRGKIKTREAAARQLSAMEVNNRQVRFAPVRNLRVYQCR